ncbi:leucine-rich repeat-containing protein 15-like [Branchiostoma floridae]|uniref:Leucine-rich repeat-containing protein 15-like n=1 Tax=Branchiostoma floridae TaxID=7739 RepID=A0A9J7LZT6_BRAFL|nr:leucine-rich repeat-containing protein 15-like [Branchiostoma floridae]
MGRKLRHLLMFLLIILKKPNMPEAGCRRSKSSRYVCMGFTSIPQNLPTSIGHLDLKNNQITKIQPGAFSHLPQLQNVDLSNNHISNIQSGTFANLPQLKELLLSSNQITMIQPCAFANLTELLSLDLSSNILTMIQAGLFANLPRLQMLVLSANQINTIQPGALLHLTRLQNLYLSNNKLTKIQERTFANLLQLQELALSYNKITMIQPGAFENLPLLQTMCLSSNAITEIQAGTFKDILRLQKLDLSYNLISKLQPGAFANLTQLQILDLRSNKMSVVPHSSFGLLKSVLTTKLDENPWQCDCRMGPFKVIMNLIEFPSFKDQIICAQPARFRGQKFIDVNLKDLICEEPTVTLPLDTQTTSNGRHNNATTAGPTLRPVVTTSVPLTLKSTFAPTFVITEGTFSSHESVPCFSLTVLIASICGSVAGTLVLVAIVGTIWCKRRTKNPSCPNCKIALSKAHTTNTGVPSGHDQKGQVQSLASTQALNMKRPPYITGSAVFQPHYYVDANKLPNPTKPKPKGTGKPTKAKPLALRRKSLPKNAPHHVSSPNHDDDDDDCVYVVPDGAIYMQPENVLYEMPANSRSSTTIDAHDNLHCYQPQTKTTKLPTDANGYVIVEPKKLKATVKN